MLLISHIIEAVLIGGGILCVLGCVSLYLLVKEAKKRRGLSN